MEIKLFGRSLFSANKSLRDIIASESLSSLNSKDSKFLPDFNKSSNDWDAVPSDMYLQVVNKKKRKKEVKRKTRVTLTPKGVFELKLLHDETFELKTDAKYVDQQIADFKGKLGMLKDTEWDMRRGIDEIASIMLRLENRKKYESFHQFYESYPYTTTSRIQEVITKHNHLQLGTIAQFIADLPKEASDVMKIYNDHTDKLCQKQAVYYIIADKKDFKKTEKRRDPILLAQSPFGHFWQILGAWDKEMLLLEEL